MGGGGRGSIFLWVYPCVFMSPATAPPRFIDRGGKPYPNRKTLKGKPLGRNPNKVNPTVFWSSTVDSYRHWILYSSRNP